MAMELAIGVMFLMIAFTIMLLSTAGLQNRHRNDDYKDFNQMIEINNVGEYVLSNYDYKNSERTSIIIDGKDTGYKVTFSNNTYTIYEGDDTEPVLTIEITDGKITSWK